LVSNGTLGAGTGGRLDWYLTDHLGSVRDIASVSGSVTNHITYTSFGEILSESTPSNGDRWTFTARELELSGEMQYRAYSPATGRFQSNDPIGFSAGDRNLGRYVSNTASSLIDPLGLKTSHTVGRISCRHVQ
jgi:RHS repeat-associated protein